MSDWDAARYHRISSPQFEWGQRVIVRLQPAAGERILDLGCGTGRLTQEIRRIAGDGHVIGLDRSGAMLAVARESGVESPQHLSFVQGSGEALPFRRAFDAVFSTATLHWITDHAAVFASVHDALKPGGRFVAQCGGRGNLDRLLHHTTHVMALRRFREYFLDWDDPWLFADVEPTVARLKQAGFATHDVWLEDAPVDLAGPDAFAEFVSCICIRHHLQRLPPELRDPFTREVTARASRDTAPFVLDYRRLNIEARRAAA